MAPEARGWDRRGFLKVSGLSVGLAAMVAACVNEREPEQLTQTGTRVPPPPTSKPPFPGDAVLDLRLLLTALSVERLAISTIDRVLNENWVPTQTTADLVRKIQDRHRQHADRLAELVGPDADGVAANPGVQEDLVDSELETVQAATSAGAREVAAVSLLADVEDALSQLYARAGGLLTTADQRGEIGAIGTATARHYTALAGPAGLPLVPLALMPTAPAAIPEANYVEVDESQVRTPGTQYAGSGTAPPGTGG